MKSDVTGLVVNNVSNWARKRIWRWLLVPLMQGLGKPQGTLDPHTLQPTLSRKHTLRWPLTVYFYLGNFQ